MQSLKFINQLQLKCQSCVKKLHHRSVAKLHNPQKHQSLTCLFSTNSSSSQSPPPRETKIQIVGDKHTYDAVKQLRLYELPCDEFPQPNLVASMHVKRNIIFGTRIHDRSYLFRVRGKSSMEQDDNEVGIHTNSKKLGIEIDGNYQNSGFIKTCKPLLKQCLEHAVVEGDQPQGLAALNGLNARIKYLLEHPDQSKAMKNLFQQQQNNEGKDENVIGYESIHALATQIPRKGHDTIGFGTYIDAREGWSKLAKEYALNRNSSYEECIVQGEAQLFQSLGAVLVGIEYIGIEENPNYWKDAGGAMARFFFL